MPCWAQNTTVFGRPWSLRLSGQFGEPGRLVTEAPGGEAVPPPHPGFSLQAGAHAAYRSQASLRPGIRRLLRLLRPGFVFVGIKGKEQLCFLFFEI